MSNNSQSVAVFSAAIGAFSGTTIAVSSYENGYGLSQLQLSSEGQQSSTITVGKSPLQFNFNAIGNIQNSGSLTTAIAFLINSSNQTNTTQFVMTGSEIGNLWLQSVNIAQGSSNLTSSNLSDGIGSPINLGSPVVAIFYDSLAPATATSNLFVGLANGDIYSYNVVFPAPTSTQTVLSCNGYCLIVNSQGSLMLYSPYYETLWTLASPNGPLPTSIYQVFIDGTQLVLESSLQSVPEQVILWEAVNASTSYCLALANNGSVLIFDGDANVVATLYQGAGTYDTYVELKSDGLSSLQLGTLEPPTINQTGYLSGSVHAGGQITIVPFYPEGEATMYICTGQGMGGLYYFTAENFNWEPIYLPPQQSTLIYTAAAAIHGTTLYVASESEVFTGVLETRLAGGWCLSNPSWENLFVNSSQTPISGLTITSLSFSNCNDTTYTQGALFIGCFSSSNSGSLYVYNPVPGDKLSANTQPLIEGAFTAGVYSLCSDCSGYVFAFFGDSGLTVTNPCPTASLETEIVSLIPNAPPHQTSWLASFLAVLSLTFAIAAAVIDPPEGGLALALTITSIDAGAAGLAVSS